jgi:hypothetical protein
MEFGVLIRGVLYALVKGMSNRSRTFGDDSLVDFVRKCKTALYVHFIFTRTLPVFVLMVAKISIHFSSIFNHLTCSPPVTFLLRRSTESSTHPYFPRNVRFG